MLCTSCYVSHTGPEAMCEADLSECNNTDLYLDTRYFDVFF